MSEKETKCPTAVMYPPKEMDMRYNDPEQNPRQTVCVDACLSVEIQSLWDAGIITTGCCCGHGERAGYIGVSDAHIAKMKERGYQVAPNTLYPEREDGFFPKTQCLHNTRPQPAIEGDVVERVADSVVQAVSDIDVASVEALGDWLLVKPDELHAIVINSAIAAMQTAKQQPNNDRSLSCSGDVVDAVRTVLAEMLEAGIPLNERKHAKVVMECAVAKAIDKARADAKAEERARCVAALDALLDEEGQYEVNTSNYHHDDVCALNAAYVSILENAVKAIEQGGGGSTEEAAPINETPSKPLPPDVVADFNSRFK